MTPEAAHTKIQELTQLLEQYEYEYYVLNAPTISDIQFDTLMKELESLEATYPQYRSPHSPTSRVGSEFIGQSSAEVSSSSYPHRTPMLSLANTYTWGEVEQFYHRIHDAIGAYTTDVVAELKFDGASISLVYEDGVLSRALTRGDGTYGEDITQAVRAIKSVPLRLRGTHLPHYIEVRGEVLLPWREFERLNAEREEAGLPLFANPRNAVSGTIKTKDNISAVIAQRKPIIIFYYLLSDDATWLPSAHHDRLTLMQELGLRISSHTQICHSRDELQAYLEYWDLHRHHLDVATDGVVVKVDDYRLHDEIGWTAKSPKWAMAYKFSAEKAITRLLSVSFQTARTGVVTPVANLEAVQLSGTTVQRASLHNGDIIQEMDLHIGDLVSIEKGGEIIPKITHVLTDKRDAQLGSAVVMPTHCPICGTALVREEGLAATVCPNEWGCSAQIEGRIEHFCSRHAMDIHIGPQTIHLLCTHLGILDAADLYDLTMDQLLTLPKFKTQKASNLLRDIEASKSQDFPRVLYAMGIKLVGVQVARKLALHFRSLDALLSAPLDQLMSLDEIGPSIAESIRAFALGDHTSRLVARLRAAGLQLEMAATALDSTPQSDLLQGQTIVISGTFDTISRDDLKALLAAHGAKVGSGITGKTTLFVTGKNIGPSKLEKATQLSIPMITEDELFDQYPQLR